MNVLTSTCTPPNTRQATASADEEEPDTITSMKAPIEPRHAHVGIDAGQRRDQDARERGEPRADQKVTKRTRGVDAEPARERLVHDHRAGRKGRAACR